jgi:hypothetical protein
MFRYLSIPEYKIDDRKLNVCLAYGFFVMKNIKFI